MALVTSLPRPNYTPLLKGCHGTLQFCFNHAAKTLVKVAKNLGIFMMWRWWTSEVNLLNRSYKWTGKRIRKAAVPACSDMFGEVHVTSCVKPLWAVLVTKRPTADLWCLSHAAVRFGLHCPFHSISHLITLHLCDLFCSRCFLWGPFYVRYKWCRVCVRASLQDH